MTVRTWLLCALLAAVSGDARADAEHGKAADRARAEKRAAEKAAKQDREVPLEKAAAKMDDARLCAFLRQLDELQGRIGLRAQAKDHTQAVQDVGKVLVAEVGKAARELQAAADLGHVDLAHQGILREDGARLELLERKLEAIWKLPGLELDEALGDQLASAHDELIATVKGARKDLVSEPVKEYADRVVKRLEDERDSVKMLAAAARDHEKQVEKAARKGPKRK